jgi:hypothetical protein
MAVKVERPTVSDVWVTALWEGKAELAAHMLAPTGANDPCLTVFWCGDTSRPRFANAVERVERLFLEKGSVQETLIAFGRTREVIGPIKRGAVGGSSSFGLDGYLSDDKSAIAQSSAYRAEFEGSQGDA